MVALDTLLKQCNFCLKICMKHTVFKGKKYKVGVSILGCNLIFTLWLSWWTVPSQKVAKCENILKCNVSKYVANRQEDHVDYEILDNASSLDPEKNQMPLSRE
jgi:hypothetical protein